MGLETGTLIKDLVSINPESGDLRRFGDDHLRLIKTVLKTQFVGLDDAGAVAILTNADEMNFSAGVTSAIQDQLDSKLETINLDLTSYARLDTAQSWSKNQHIPAISHGVQSGTLIIDMNTSDSHFIIVTDNITISLSSLSEGQNVFLALQQSKGPVPATISLSGPFAFPFSVSPGFTETLNATDVITGKMVNGILMCGFLPEVGLV